MGRHGSSVRTDMEMGRGHRHPWSIGEGVRGQRGGEGSGWCRTTQEAQVSEVKVQTDVVVVTLSAAALLTSFLLESRLLAAFRSLRRFSAAFFMVLSSPG